MLVVAASGLGLHEKTSFEHFTGEKVVVESIHLAVASSWCPRKSKADYHSLREIGQ